jgi:hypothetical protein
MIRSWSVQQGDARADGRMDKGIEIVPRTSDYGQCLRGLPFILQVEAQPVLMASFIDKVLDR